MKRDSVVERAARTALADALVAKASWEVDVLRFPPLAGGRVVTFGSDDVRRGVNQPTRTEVRVDDNVVVVIHKNFGQAEGMFAAAARFSHIVVLKDRQVVATLLIKVDPTTSQFNPIYVFRDNDEEIGKGYGQSMDLRIASGLLGVYVGGPSDYVSPSVIDWIRDKAGLS